MTASETTDAKIYAEEFLEIARDGVPYVGQLGLIVESWEAGHVALRLPYADLIRRPGGTICGPALMGLADVALYGAVMSLLGRAELAVTTDLSFHFLSKPDPVDILAEARILKLGRRLAVGEVSMTSEGKILSRSVMPSDPTPFHRQSTETAVIALFGRIPRGERVDFGRNSA